MIRSLADGQEVRVLRAQEHCGEEVLRNSENRGSWAWPRCGLREGEWLRIRPEPRGSWERGHALQETEERQKTFTPCIAKGLCDLGKTRSLVQLKWGQQTLSVRGHIIP